MRLFIQADVAETSFLVQDLPLKVVQLSNVATVTGGKDAGFVLYFVLFFSVYRDH
jgi:hypothetical protein